MADEAETISNGHDGHNGDTPVESGEPIEETEVDRQALAVNGEARPRLPFAVVGVGASAGGLEAYTEFLQHVRADSGMAYVLVQHLSPKHESLMAELLAKHTHMPVLQVEDQMEVAADHVYFIRPGFTMRIRDGRLHLGESAAEAGHRRPVDDFFKSLAQEQRERAIAVILSGTGSNGTAGAAAIKAVGGLCVAQDPETAKFPSMPRSLIEAGLADSVLKPGEIFKFVAAFANHPYAAGEAATPDVVARNERLALAEVLSVLRARVRHDFSGYKKPTLVRRIQRRMSLLQQSRMVDYVRSLRQSTTEVHALADDLMIHVTGFFRDPGAWESLLTKVILPLVREREDQGTIRCWVTACSSGEEAYTMGMLLLEASEQVGKSFDIKIFATDTAERSLSQARAGIFPGGIESEITPARLERFFDKNDAFYHVKRDLRELVVFAPQNVLQDPPFSRLDIVTCRNFLIYIEPDVQKRVLQMLHFGLRDGGAMMLGSSEAINGSEDLFEPIDKRNRLFRRVGATRHGMIDFPVMRPAGRQPAGVVEFDAPRTLSRMNVSQLTHRLLLDKFTPAAVVVDRQGRIVYYHGSTDRYLEQPRGEPTRELLVLAREEIRGALRGALSRAFTHNEPVEVLDGTLGQGDTRTRLLLTVTPLEPRLTTVHFLVSFVERPDPPALIFEPGQEASAQLTDSLRRAREELQSTVEELQTSNEEMKASHEEITSVNEELQSANEELETSKEELQSLNEELTTVNAQLQAKMDELERTTNDLGSLLSSTDIAVVFLDTQFRIRRFTPATRDLMELIPADIGRPLSDLNRKFTDDALITDAQVVLDRLLPREAEIVSDSGHWYTRWVLPYRTADNRIDGVVVTFVDVTARKTAADALKQSEERYRVLVSSAAVGICETNPAGVFTYVNDRYCQLVARRREELLEGMTIDQISHPDDVPLCQQALQRLYVTGVPFSLEKRYVRATGEVIWVNTFVNLTRSADGRITGAVDVAVDISERRDAVEAHRVAEERLRYNSEASGVGDWEVNALDRKVYLSPRACQLLGVTPDEAVDFDRLLRAIHPDDRKAVTWAADQALDPAGDGVFEVECRRNAESGPAVWVEGRGRTVFDGDGDARRAVRVHGTMQDVTARKESEFLRAVVLESEQAARAEAEAANASKDQFLANASHELRTPLSAILLWSNLLQAADVDAGTLREGMIAIEYSAKAQQKLIDDLMDSARISAGKVKLELLPTDLRAVVSSAVDTLRPAADAKEVHVHTDSGDDIGHVKADGERLQQVVWNLVSNALKFTPVGGRIDVVLRRRGKQVEIRVSDTGAGIPTDVLPEIFRRFRQADPSATRRHGGLGLGLAISRQLVELHGGTIAAASEGEGRGATFTVLLPLPRRAAGLTRGPADDPAAASLVGARVLLVEDDVKTREALARVLSKAGATVEAVGHVDDALAAIARERPGVLVSDIGLPDKDGHELIRAIRAAETSGQPRLPAIALSAFDRPHAQAKATESGFDIYLAKPIDPKRLLAVLREALALS